MNFQARMTELARTLDASPDRALDLAESLEKELLAARKVDPSQLGWARDYRIRCLYRLGRHDEGLRVLTTPPPRPMAISTKNAAWLHSVGAEMALHVGAPRQVLVLIGKALDLRVADEDGISAAMAVETGFALLRRLEDPSLLDTWYAEVEARSVAAIPHAVAASLTDCLAAVADAAWFQAASPSTDRRRAEQTLHDAAADGDTEAVAALLAAGVAPGARNPRYGGLPTPLIAAAFNGHSAVAFALLTAGADIDATNVQGRTALHLAADQNHPDVVALLCQSGATLDAADHVDHTPLHLAAWQDHRASVDALVRAGAPLTARDRNGDTPLALAASEPVPEVIRALLAAGADLEDANDHGQPPLMRAAMEGRADVVAVLLAAGADRNRRDRNRRTALDWARAGAHDDVVVLLRDRKR